MKNKFFYPIADSFERVQKYVQCGIKILQLRIKNQTEELISVQIKKSIDYCKQHDCQLFINDYWQHAVEFSASGVHLGQEDLATADLKIIAENGIRLGLSTHDLPELKTALAANPFYIALGPIFFTASKIMRFDPQGYEKISEWRKLIPKNISLIAIGGIKLEHADQIFSAGADGISVISDLSAAQNTQKRIQDWFSACARQVKSLHVNLK